MWPTSFNCSSLALLKYSCNKVENIVRQVCMYRLSFKTFKLLLILNLLIIYNYDSNNWNDKSFVTRHLNSPRNEKLGIFSGIPLFEGELSTLSLLVTRVAECSKTYEYNPIIRFALLKSLQTWTLVYHCPIKASFLLTAILRL